MGKVGGFAVLTFGVAGPVAAGLAALWVALASATDAPPSATAPVAPAPIELHFSPDEDLEAIDVGLIEEAGERIEVAAYVLSDEAVVEALRDAAVRGAKVRVLVEPANDDKDAAELDELRRAPGVEVRLRRRPDEAWMHMKAYAVDRVLYRGGAANFSRSGENRQDNDLMIVRDAATAARFEAKFQAMWETGK